MPIHVPGIRNRRKFSKSPAKRSAVAVLSLVAMVDMFTVLAVFLLQNYATTGKVIHISEGVTLPNAEIVKELKPSNVVSLNEGSLSLNSKRVGILTISKDNWILKELKNEIEKIIVKGERDKKSFLNKTKKAINSKANDLTVAENLDPFRRITIQADKSTKFLDIKKIMYTVTEAGIYEINFAVIKESNKIEETLSF